MARVPALLVMHADLSAALLRAARNVYEEVSDVETLSNEGLSRDALVAVIEERVQAWEHGGLVFADFWGSSCHQCGVRAARGHGEVIVVTGINLPTLIDYLHNRDSYSVTDLAERLLKKGQDSFKLQRGKAA